MRLRSLGSITAVLLAMGVLATGAAGAVKPKLWIIGPGGGSRAAVGEVTRLEILAGGCAGKETASIASNGKPVDHVAGTGALSPQCEAGFKLDGTIKSVALTPGSGEGEFTMTVTGLVHLGVEPWCTYTLPHKFSLPAVLYTQAEATLTAALDKAASFGTCPPTRAIETSFVVVDIAENFAYQTELVG
jgi:hypothetical protein